MTQLDCQRCGLRLPMNETLRVGSRSLCRTCAQVELGEPGNEKIKPAAQIDPTICVGCQLDNGSTPLPQLPSGLPVCEPCRTAFLNRPYPGWVKASLAAVLALAVFSFAHNWRFFKAHLESLQANRAMQAGDFDTAAALMGSASRRVPDSADLSAAASLFRGLALVRQERFNEALPLLAAFKKRYPEAQGFDNVMRMTEMSAAFDREDYDQFLAKAKENQARAPNDPMALGWLSSAYACKYAQTGAEEYRQESFRYLEHASKIQGADKPDFLEYEERIQHRLATREILSRSEYQRRYPAGWKGQGK